MSRPPSRSSQALARTAFACVLAALLAGCNMLPSLRDKPEEPAAEVRQPAQFGPAPPRNVAPPAAPAPGSEIKTYPGTGVFVSSNPPKEQPPGPEEATLNFESLDVREVAKVILGDYLHESYAVHPGVTGSVTFR